MFSNPFSVIIGSCCRYVRLFIDLQTVREMNTEYALYCCAIRQLPALAVGLHALVTVGVLGAQGFGVGGGRMHARKGREENGGVAGLVCFFFFTTTAPVVRYYT